MLVDYYAALARIEKIRAKAAREVEPFERSAREAVCRMGRLGEPVPVIAELTQLPAGEVRATLASAKRKPGGPRPNGSSSDVSATELLP